MSANDIELFDKVLFLGPDMRGHGGIASVLMAYERELPVFHFLPTNSPKGALAGLGVVFKTMLKMPLYRIKGRSIAHIHFTMQKSWPRKRVVAKWAKLLGYKVVMHCHTANIDSVLQKGKAMGDVLNQYSHTIALAKYWKNIFDNNLGCKNTTIVPNIVVPLKSSPMPPCDERHPLTFLFLAVLSDHKGIWELVDACRQLKKSERNSWRLLVAGSGDVARFRDMVTLYGLDEHIEYLGWVSGDEKSSAMSKSHVVILPSHREGLPITILEALSQHRGVIATPVGGVPEIIQDGISGQLVQVKDVDGIARAMQYYIDHPEKAAEHGQIGSSILNRFTPQVVITALQKIYSQL